jgi:hypothetical protein
MIAPQRGPAKEIALGRIQAKVWANQANDGEVWFNVTVVRRWKADDGWKESGSFGRDDLPIVALAVNLAYEWILDQKTGVRSGA